MDNFRFANGSRAKMGEKTVHRYVQKGTFVIISKNLRMLYLDCERCGEPGGLVRCTWGREVWVRAEAGSLCCVLGKDTQPSQCLFQARSINGHLQNKLSGKPEEIDEGGLR